MIKRLNRLYSQFLLGALLLCSASIHAQQTHLLLDPTGAGGFELGATFEDNGWTVINETQTNQWVLGAVPEWFAGNRGAYISNNSGVDYTYSTSSISRVHFYKDIVFPTGVESAAISLDVSLLGESTWDNVLVYLVDTNVVPSSVGPTSNTLSGWTADISTIASQVTGATPNNATLNPEWTNYSYGVTGYYLDAVLRLNSVAGSSAVLTNLVINLTPEQVAYVSGNTKRLVVTWRNDGSGGAQPPGSVDNIKVEAYVPACYMVDGLATSDVTDTSFITSWTSDANSTGYNYEVRSSGEPGSGATGLISEGTLTGAVSTFLTSNLSANQTYYVYVKKSCSTDLGSSNWKQIAVTTLCGVSGYFTENFDTTSTGTSTNQTVPACWLFIDSGVGSGYVSTSADFSVPNGFYMSNGADTSSEYLLVSPQTENLGNGGARIRFRAKTTSTSTSPSTTLKVVTLANQENLIGMVQVTEITLTTSFDEFVVNLPAGTNDYFAFMHGLNANSRVIYLDDIVYEPIPPCSSPSVLELDNVGVNSVTITFPMPTGLPTGAQFEYEIRTEGLPGSGTEGLFTSGFKPITANTFTIDELDHTTNYVIYVRSNCGVGSVDSWRELAFTTLCGVYTTIDEGFDTVTTGSSTNPTRPSCWGYIDSGSGYAYVNTTAQYDSTKGYYMYNGSDVENDLILVSPETNNLGNGTYRLRFRAKTTSALGADLQIVTLANQENSNGIQILETINLTTNYDEYTVYLPQGTNDFFGFRHGLNATLRYIYIDDVVYEPIPACPSVLDLISVSSTTSTATFSWDLPTAIPADAQLYYEVRTSGDAGSGEEGLVATGNFVAATETGVVTNLQHSTQYVLYVKTVCTAEGFDGWKQVDFVTECEMFDVVNESFTNTPVGSSTNMILPLCWSFIDEGAGFGFVSTGSNFTAPRGFQMSNSTDTSGSYVLVSPETNNLGNGNYRLRFRAKTTSANGENLLVLTLPGTGSTDSSVVLETIPLTTTYKEFIVYIPLGTHDYFGLKHGTSASSRIIYIDDVVLEPRPTCVEVENVEGVMNYAQSAITLTWENPDLLNLSNQFEVQYGLAGFELGTGTTQLATGLNTTITGLVQGSTYEFYVRRICSETDNSAWSEPISVLLDYCLSIPTSNDGNGITSFTMGTSTFPITDVMYVDLLQETPVALNSQDTITSSITFATGYTYDTHIWIDFNRDGIFDNQTEKVFTGMSTNANPTTLDTSFTIADVYETGIYRMRIGTADSGQATPNSCFSGTYGVTIDLKVNISFPCLLPIDLTVSDLTNNSVLLDWNAAGTNYDIEYGPQGFQQGTGTVISNVNKPYNLSGLTEATNYSFYVKQVCVDGQSDWSQISNFRTLCGTPSPEGVAFQTLVEDDYVTNIVVQGQNLKYYADVEMTQQLAPNTVLEEGFYYITQTVGCESDIPFEVFVTLIERIDEPVVQPIQEFCGQATISQLSAQALPGATLNWYDVSTGGVALPADTVVSQGVYYVNQTDGTTTSHRVAVNVVINQVPVDLVPMTVVVCGFSNYESLQVNQEPGVTMRWYASLNATTPINNLEEVVTGIYYVTQSYGICESNRVAITVNVYDSLPAPVAGIQTFCGSATISDLEAQGVAGTELKWFASLTSTVPLNDDVQLSSGTYYVQQENDNCVSPRRAVAVRIASTTAPTVSPFIFCGSATVSDLYIPSQSGVTFKWYLSPSSTNELSQNTALNTGTYYVSRLQYGICDSERAAVQVTIQSLPNAPTGSTVQSFVEGSLISDLVLNETNVVWYISENDALNSINPLQPNMPLVNGTTYYAVIIGTNGCPSLPFAVTVDVYLSNGEFDKKELNYYPNPISDFLNVSYSEIITEIEVFDLLGKRVKTIQTNDNQVQVNFSDLPSGTYMIQLKTATKQQFIKVIKK